jgi:hypothetical protein
MSSGVSLQFIQQLRPHNHFNYNIEEHCRCMKTLHSYWPNLNGMMPQIIEANSGYILDLFLFPRICPKKTAASNKPVALLTGIHCIA